MEHGPRARGAHSHTNAWIFQATLLNAFRVGNIRNGISLVDIAREFGFAYTPLAPKSEMLTRRAQGNKRKHHNIESRFAGFQFSWQQTLILAVLKSLMAPADDATEPLVVTKDAQCSVDVCLFLVVIS